MRRSLTARRVVVLVTTAALLATLGTPADAGENDVFGVTPHPPRVDGEARRSLAVPAEGGAFRDAVRVYNRTDDPIVVTLYPASVEPQPDGVLAVGFRGQDGNGPIAEMTLDEAEVELEPRAAAVVPLTIRAPDDPPAAPLGAVVVQQGGSSETEQTGIDLVQRVAILVQTAEPGSSVAATPVDEGSAGPLPWAIGLASAAALPAILLRRRRSDEAADQVPDEDRAGQVHERVHTAPPPS